MANSSKGQSQYTEESNQRFNQFSPSRFDFETFIAENIAVELQQPPPQDENGLHYDSFDDYTNIDLALTIPYSIEEPESGTLGPYEREDGFHGKTLFSEQPYQNSAQPLQVPEQPFQVLPRLEVPQMKHGSSSIPVTVTSPLDQTNRQPYAVGPYGSQPNVPRSYLPRPHITQPYVSQPYGGQSYAPQSYAPQPYFSQPYAVQPNALNSYLHKPWQNSAPITRPSSALAIPRPMDQPLKGTYLNPILNHFSCPSTPLQVIDNYKYPFEDELQRALEAELKRQNEISKKQSLADYYQAELRRRRESNEVLEAKIAQVAQDLPVLITPAPTPIRDGTKTPRNKRPINISNNDPKKWYRPLPMAPDSWGSINPDTQDRTFNYTIHGELNPRDRFSVQQMSEYISSHRARLWIQTVPADSGRRYPTKTSDKCRFINCPDSNRTIRKGDYRVAFDEQPSNTDKDPFHNAAYTHLYCLEKFLDFPQICKNFDVRPDVRKLKEGKNKMAITRDHKSMEGIVLDFIRNSVEWRYFDGGVRPLEYYEFTLCSKLTREHLAKQSKHIQTVREQRGGNTIDIHQNNLDVFVANQHIRKRQADEKNSVSGSVKGKKRGRKRSSRDKSTRQESDESGLDNEILQRGLSFSAPVLEYQPQPEKIKRKGMSPPSPSSGPRQKRRKENRQTEESDNTEVDGDFANEVSFPSCLSLDTGSVGPQTYTIEM
ncbi:hypothetical protein ONS95_009719 [Cadophora gregata]|uniref:uncharacterized protein n=1 Tax=Cadophora gregata TaxID=51156 RepID=UPI0026DC6E11|nr:uncharacterized protein ONS95_009719 [Cadophora gregata]KAK0121425.1 hypothetical protein ONS95_009719 [Cadophora gregata]KAK0126895.1 hypothetical protein ONS96_006460 [Cadophora gregata f. sp. sojae]